MFSVVDVGGTTLPLVLVLNEVVEVDVVDVDEVEVEVDKAVGVPPHPANADPAEMIAARKAARRYFVTRPPLVTIR